MIQLFTELQEKKNVRSNLSALRASLKEATEEQKAQAIEFVRGHEDLVFGFLQEEDAKTRKNAALLLGDLAVQNALQPLWKAYTREQTLFVKSAYLEAMKALHAEEILSQLKDRLAELEGEPVTEENRKHREAELRALRAILIQYEGIDTHHFDIKQKNNHVLLVTNRNHRGILENQTGGKAHPLGVIVQTDDLLQLLQIRTYRDMLFLLPVKGLLEQELEKAAEAVWKPMLAICAKYHREDKPFFFRIECRSAMTLEQRSRFVKKLGSAIEQLSDGKLVNSPGDYEVELRLIANREGKFFPALKFYTIPDHRFAYRKHAIAASMHPSLAALIMELAAPYLKENYWCVNKNADPADIQATLDFMEWVVTSDTGRDALANTMGFVTPFKTFEDGYQSQNPLVLANDEYTKAGKTPVSWNFTTMPSEEWKNGVGSALLEYAQGTGDWDAVVTAFVDGWKTEYDAAHAE